MSITLRLAGVFIGASLAMVSAGLAAAQEPDQADMCDYYYGVRDRFLALTAPDRRFLITYEWRAPHPSTDETPGQEEGLLVTDYDTTFLYPDDFKMVRDQIGDAEFQSRIYGNFPKAADQINAAVAKPYLIQFKFQELCR